MALKSTIYKVELNVADMDHGYYGTHALTIARHPSETDERMMLRVLAFALHAGEGLEFGRGISDEDEPALWRRNLVDEVELWIDLGQPDERRLKKAANRAADAWVYTYGARTADVWWQGVSSQAGRYDNLHVRALDGDTMAALGTLAERGMTLHVTIQEGEISLSNGDDNIAITLRTLLG
ncbi:YaeQ family protein [Chitiniphilus eburneus]|uniref:YaeQ family protein n=1 Tax=Chitiniphilus eburneus TaxID=2571148 RepID=UPI0035CFB276